MQMKMIEVWKLFESKKDKKDIGWDLSRWVESGMAKKFADIYDEKLILEEINFVIISYGFPFAIAFEANIA